MRYLEKVVAYGAYDYTFQPARPYMNEVRVFLDDGKIDGWFAETLFTCTKPQCRLYALDSRRFRAEPELKLIARSFELTRPMHARAHCCAPPYIRVTASNWTHVAVAWSSSGPAGAIAEFIIDGVSVETVRKPR